MIVNPQVPLHRVILSLSEVLDYVHPYVPEHQQRVAYIAISVARKMQIAQTNLLDIFLAGTLHDIGMVRTGDIETAAPVRAERLHAEAGYMMLKDNFIFTRAAGIIRYHHVCWEGGRGAYVNDQKVPFASHILSLSDSVERAVDRRLPVLQQSQFIIEQVRRRSGSQFHPDVVDAFCQASKSAAFWLDCQYDRVYSLLLKQIDWPVLTIDAAALEHVAELFGSIVDARSRWTGSHSAGVASTAVSLAKLLKFSPREQQMMRTAGYLHDLGKLAVPGYILDKTGKLTEQEWALMKSHTYHTFRVLDTIGDLQQMNEWASFHHERLDGTGYPFMHRGSDLTLGSRIMAVADVFTAVSEDRPYREGKSLADAMNVLTSGVERGAIDGDVVEVLRGNSDQIDGVRRREQAEYSRKQALSSGDSLMKEANLFGVQL